MNVHATTGKDCLAFCFLPVRAWDIHYLFGGRWWAIRACVCITMSLCITPSFSFNFWIADLNLVVETFHTKRIQKVSWGLGLLRLSRAEKCRKSPGASSTHFRSSEDIGAEEVSIQSQWSYSFNEMERRRLEHHLIWFAILHICWIFRSGQNARNSADST